MDEFSDDQSSSSAWKHRAHVAQEEAKRQFEED